VVERETLSCSKHREFGRECGRKVAVTKKRELLTEALVRQHIVKFWNRHDAGSTAGYVLEIGPHFFLLAYIDNDMRFDGYQCVLLKDVTRLEAPARYNEFMVAALRKRKQRIRRRPDIKMNTIAELLESANQHFPLVTIHREGVKPGCCWIGRIIDISDSRVVLHEIGPDAVWDEKPKSYRLSEVTRVEFGGGYEEALFLVAGELKVRNARRNHAN
jgi:hypothetical protein